MRQRLGICWHFFTKEVTFETWVHKELKSSTILFSHVISTFWSKWLWKRIGRSLYKPSIQNKLFQLCSKCHSNPLRVNIKPVPLKKNLIMRIVQNWAAIRLTELRLRRFIYSKALQSLRSGLAQRYHWHHTETQPSASATYLSVIVFIIAE